MVWIGISHDSRSLPAAVWPNLHAIQYQVVVSHVIRNLRGWESHLWGCTQFQSIDCWSRHPRFGKRRNLDWKFRRLFACSPVEEETGIDSSGRNNVCFNSSYAVL